jgi:hypothetical protein
MTFPDQYRLSVPLPAKPAETGRVSPFTDAPRHSLVQACHDPTRQRHDWTVSSMPSRAGPHHDSHTQTVLATTSRTQPSPCWTSLALPALPFSACPEPDMPFEAQLVLDRPRLPCHASARPGQASTGQPRPIRACLARPPHAVPSQPLPCLPRPASPSPTRPGITPTRRA